MEKVLVVREDAEREIERIVHEVRGETWPMKSARLRQALWDRGVVWADRLGVRGDLRRLVGRMQRWYS